MSVEDVVGTEVRHQVLRGGYLGDDQPQTYNVLNKDRFVEGVGVDKLGGEAGAVSHVGYDVTAV